MSLMFKKDMFKEIQLAYKSKCAEVEKLEHKIADLKNFGKGDYAINSKVKIKELNLVGHIVKITITNTYYYNVEYFYNGVQQYAILTQDQIERVE